MSENAQVFEDARVYGNAAVSGFALVTAKVHKNTKITKGVWDEDAYLEWFFTHERQTA